MDLTVRNTALEIISVIDEFSSLIWTERYSEYGDFELYSPTTQRLLSVLQPDYYLCLKDSDRVMIVEDVGIETDAEQGDHLTVAGRSLESILDRRIIWKQTILDGNFQNGIKKLLDENVINPSDIDRRIPNLVFSASSDPAITNLSIRAQFTGDNLYEAIKALCDVHNIGFKITLSDSLQFVFRLYSGKDRTYSQSENAYVIFSPSFGNLPHSNYLESKKPLKTVALIAGEGEGAERKTAEVKASNNGSVGLNRRELYVDARDISSTTEEEPLSDADYSELLSQRGKERLSENAATQSFEGQLDTHAQFVYGRDFQIGDIVEIANEYGIRAKACVAEFVRSQSASGVEAYPTFVMVE